MPSARQAVKEESETAMALLSKLWASAGGLSVAPVLCRFPPVCDGRRFAARFYLDTLPIKVAYGNPNAFRHPMDGDFAGLVPHPDNMLHFQFLGPSGLILQICFAASKCYRSADQSQLHVKRFSGIGEIAKTAKTLSYVIDSLLADALAPQQSLLARGKPST